MAKETRGRKPVEEHLRKIGVQVYFERYKIEQLGGIENVQSLLLECIENKLNNNKKPKKIWEQTH
jgi:hypothetical protein